MDKKFIIAINGQNFVTHEGLLNEFHTNGGKSIETKMIDYNENLGMFIFKATVAGEKGLFVGHGDASPMNVNKMIAPHIARMAETRAVNRALRFYNNIGMCSADELGENTSESPQVKKSYPKKAASKASSDYIELTDGSILKSGLKKDGTRWYGRLKDGNMDFINDDPSDSAEDKWNALKLELAPKPKLDNPDF